MLRLILLIVVAISLIGTSGSLAAIAQETDIANNDTLDSPLNQTIMLKPDDAVDMISSQLAQLRAVAPEVNIENLTATEVSDLLELYGLDTYGPVCPPCH